MAKKLVQFNMKIEEELAQAADATAERIGLNKTDAVRVFLKRFVSYGGFPFDMRIEESPGRTLQDTSTIYTQTPDIYEEFTKHQDFPDLAYKALAEQVKDKDILDVGVGGGRWVIRFAPIAKSILGFDTSENYINIAKEKTKGFDNVQLRVADAKDIDLPKNHFDVIFASFFFSIFPKVDKPNEEMMNQYLEHLWSSLKVGGKFILLEGGTGDEYDAKRFWQQETAEKFRKWVKKSGFVKTSELDTFWKFDSTEHAKKTLHEIWGDKMSSQIAKPTMTQKLLVFEKVKTK